MSKNLFIVDLKSEQSPASGHGISSLNGSVMLKASLKSVGLLGSVLKSENCYLFRTDCYIADTILSFYSFDLCSHYNS